MLLLLILLVALGMWLVPRPGVWLLVALTALGGGVALVALLVWAAQPTGRPSGCERLRDLWRPHYHGGQLVPNHGAPGACDAAGRPLQPRPVLQLEPPDVHGRVLVRDAAHPYRDAESDALTPAPVFQGTPAAAAGFIRRQLREWDAAALTH